MFCARGEYNSGMKKLSSRAAAILTNCILILIVISIGVVCFLPSASVASEVDERVYYHGNASDGVSVMINVYWGGELLDGFLDVLDEYGAKATFFLGGSWADDNVPLVKKIAEKGHEIASHGYFHREHDKLSYEANREEIKTSADYLSLASGQEIKLFAPPSGAYSEKTLLAAESLGLKTVMWSKDTIDWRDKDEQLCFRRATEGVKGGDLILMHPMAHTLKALPRILRDYLDKGLYPITVSENLG